MQPTESCIANINTRAHFHLQIVGCSICHASVGAGLKIMASHRTMFSQDDNMSGQNVGVAVILTGCIHGFQRKIHLFTLILEIINS